MTSSAEQRAQLDFFPAGAADEQPRKAHRGTNQLNDLDTREWLVATKSVWYQGTDHDQLPCLEEVTCSLRESLGDDRAAEILGQVFDSVLMSKPPTRDSLKIRHPATFAESDVEKLIRFFSKAGETVLDPFLGSGSTLIAARAAGRRGIGVEIAKEMG